MEEDTRQALAGARAAINNWVENDARNEAVFMDLSDEEDCEDEDFETEPCLDESNKEQTECGKKEDLSFFNACTLWLGSNLCGDTSI